MTTNHLWSTPPRRASKGCSSNKRREGEAKGYGLTRPANHYTLASCPPSKTRRHVYWKGGIVNKRYDEPVVYASKQLATTRHKIPVLYPNDVLPNPGQRITLTNSGERGTMVGWANDDHQPVVRLDNGSYAAFTPQSWLPEVIVKGKRHLPADDLDKLFLGMMTAPLVAYGLAHGLGLGIGGGSVLEAPLASQVSAANAPTAARFVGKGIMDLAAMEAGNEAGNMLTRQYTPYNLWGDYVSGITPLPRWAADLTNPFGLSAPSFMIKGASALHNAGERVFRKVYKPTRMSLEDAPVTNKNILRNNVNNNKGENAGDHGILQETKKAAELGRKEFLKDLNSPDYRQIWLNEGVPAVVTDAILKDMNSLAKEPIDFSETADGLQALGKNIRRKKIDTYLEDGTKITNKSTGSDIKVASDLGEDAKYTTIHEELHHTTNNSEGHPLHTPDPNRYNYSKFMESVVTKDVDGNIVILPTKRYQNYMMDQNENLLPTRDPLYTLCMDYPERAEEEFIRQGFTPEAAKMEVKKRRLEVGDLWNVQEQRSYLKTWFSKNISPHLRNPRNAEEIEQFFYAHPSLINTDKSVWLIMKKLRPGSLKDYAKYFAESLAILPVVNSIINNHKKQKQ